MNIKMSAQQRAALLQTLLVLGISLLIAAVLIIIVGENPWHVTKIFMSGAFGSPYDLGLSVCAALPLILTGLAVSLAFKSRVINIGVEGQLTMGAMAAVLAGIYGPEDVALNRLCGLLAAACGGWLWGAVLGYLRAYRQSHEVVAGIMLNYVAYGITSWLVLGVMHNPNSQNPETIPIGAGMVIAPFQWFTGAAIGWQIVIPIFVAILYYLVFRYTRAGFNITASGENPIAAAFSGIAAPAQLFKTLSFSGLIAGLVGFLEVYGNSGRFVIGFSPGWGFTGIAVALLGRKHPVGVILAAVLFGALYKGALDLDFETEVITRDFAVILQATLVLLISCKATGLVDWFRHRRRAHG